MQDLPGCDDQIEPRIMQVGIIVDELVCVVIRMQQGCQFAQVMDQQVRLFIECSFMDHVLIGVELADEFSLVFFGQQVQVFETIFDIDGFGLLALTAIVDRDYPVVMGVVFLSSLLLLIGNILSDILVALVDPRIRFH